MFDLLALNGWDLRGCALVDRKQLLKGTDSWDGQLRYSDHHDGSAETMHREACRLGLEGVICKQNVPYRAGRSGTWVKVKCLGREEFVVLGWTPPGGSRSGIGSLHVGYHDRAGKLHYAGGVGTGYSDRGLTEWHARLEPRAAPAPTSLLYAGDPLDPHIHWVRPELVIEVRYTAWSGAGRVRHPVYLGVREDKAAREVVRPVADPEAPRRLFEPRKTSAQKSARSRGWKGAIPPRR